MGKEEPTATSDSRRPRRKVCPFSYALGCFTILLLLVPFVLRFVHVCGLPHLKTDVEQAFAVWRPKHARVLDLPEEVRAELEGMKAVVSNAWNPTHQKEHDTFLVQPASYVGWALRPHVRVSAYMLSTVKPYNLDPPVLYLPAEAPRSPRLDAYLRTHARLQYNITTNAEGHRITWPHVESRNKILVVGDSVAFGLGVDDRETIPSHLQRLVGKTWQVENAGVGSYDGWQVSNLVKYLKPSPTYKCLVYVICQNDFMPEKWFPRVEKALGRIAEHASRFEHGVIVLFHTYLEYEARDVILQAGWPKEELAYTDRLRAEVKRVATKHHMLYLDWSRVVQRYQQENASFLAPMALYADHCHLSPLGCRLAAREIHRGLQQLHAIPGADGH